MAIRHPRILQYWVPTMIVLGKQSTCEDSTASGRQHTFDASSAYRYVAIVVTRIHGTDCYGGDGMCVIDELECFGSPEVTCVGSSTPMAVMCTVTDPEIGSSGTESDSCDNVATLEAGEECTPVCNSGYTLAGTTSCSADGTLTVATCSKILCAANERVNNNNECIPCPAATTNGPSDDASGGETTCDDVICVENEYVLGNACKSCPAGTTNANGGDNASGDDTTCDKTMCAVNERVETNTCVACALGTTNDAGDDALDDNTACGVTYCVENQHVKANECVSCSTGTSNDAGNDASGDNTACTATKCGVDQYVSDETCTACMGGSTNPDGGDDASGDAMTCVCAAHERVVSNECVACAEGETNTTANPVPGANTVCNALVSPPPPPPPPPLVAKPPPPSSVEGMIANAEAKQNRWN